MTTIVLAEDHHIVRHGLKAVLAAERDFKLVGEAGDGLETIRQVERHQPNVLVLDLTLPRLHGVEVARQVWRSAPLTRVLILSMHANEAYVLEALRNDAAGYLLKDDSGVDLVRAVREVAAGRRYLALAAEGSSYAEIAEKLFISPRTVETHRTNLMRKLNLKTQTDLVRFAIRRGILPM